MSKVNSESLETGHRLVSIGLDIAFHNQYRGYMSKPFHNGLVEDARTRSAAGSNEVSLVSVFHHRPIGF